MSHVDQAVGASRLLLMTRTASAAAPQKRLYTSTSKQLPLWVPPRQGILQISSSDDNQNRKTTEASISAHLNSDWRVIVLPEARSLISSSAPEVLSIRQQSCSRHAYVLVDRLYSSVCAFDQELGVEKALGSEDDTVVTL